ncbi:autocrine proliferation repressor protein A-like [Biomphalaria glabrata]|uniref:Autocrine proliferation repressor protein A-like n=2 Tax=Biomphalaria glabrata TaxID=6526 RepID=A0A9W2ZQN6_BIOGL|nr:autocrine proliferation repressor protein A-like [Biomphalaria glabrata]
MTALRLACWAVTLTIITATPLDDYVNAPDPNYGYRYLTSIQGPNFGVYLLNMTSQKWLTDAVTTTPVWWHVVAVIIPSKIEYTDTAFLWIGDHSSTYDITMEEQFIQTMTALAVSTGTVCGVIYQVPFQPIVFKDDPDSKSRVEDAIIAWTWRKFLDNGTNPEILLRLPMTKAVVRGMDTLSAFAKPYTGFAINKFVVGGESKRGWTTWTTAAVDKRVIGMVPTVMDLLNIQKNLHHHYRSLGGWTFAFGDYYTERVTIDLDSPVMKLMQAVIDPITYSNRYTMPKMIVTTSGDEFFLPDDSYYYFDQLPGPKFLRIVPNAEHSMKGHLMSDILALHSFYLTILENATFPTMSWTRSSTSINGKIMLTTSVEPIKVTMYYAKTLDGIRRDFRLVVKDPNSQNPMVHPVVWLNGEVQKINATQYMAVVDRPIVGWAAFFIQVHFNGPKGSTLEFTTEVNIVPDTFPFPDCSGTSCVGSLV